MWPSVWRAVAFVKSPIDAPAASAQLERWMITRTNVRKVRAAATRARLQAAGRQLFTLKGYHATGTNDLVALAEVTRGALYHHYADKEALFEAVFREVAEELAAAAGEAAIEFTGDPWRQLREGLQTYLRLVAANPGVQRVLLVDGPVVFGWARWREIQSDYTFNQLCAGLQALMELGLMVETSPQPLAHLILAALNDAALSIANATDREGARAVAAAALTTLVDGLHKRGDQTR